MTDDRIPPMAIDRIGIDVTETVATGRWTGIERVVRRLSVELRAVDGPEIRLVVAIGGRFHELNDAGEERLARPPRPAPGVPGRREGGSTRAIGTLLSYAPPLLLLVQSLRKERLVRTVVRPLADPRPADFGAGDLVLLLDSHWAGTSSIRAARRARQAGAAIVSVVYDLIPITHPTYMPRSLASGFARAIGRALRISDAAVAISQASADELRRWLGRRLPRLPIASSRLGNDPAAAVVPEDRPFGRRYAMIGTIEPRKGHDLVLDAFERRWAAGVDCHLTIVGRMGWASPAMRDRLAVLTDERRLRIVHDADDAMLATILSQTDAVVMASKTEGFGLPIVEALALGIPVIASDIAIFREIGGDAVLFFDPHSAPALIAAMEAMEDDPERSRARARAFAWPSWNVAARELLAIVGDLLHDRAPSSLD